MRIAITGTSGRLGQALCDFVGSSSEHSVLHLGRSQLDLAHLEGTTQGLEALGKEQPEALIHCAALSSVDQCEQNPELAYRVNAQSAGQLAHWAAERVIPMLHVSTDYVFSGSKPGLKKPTDPAEPLQVYGKSKLLGEQLVLAASSLHQVVRVSWLFGAQKPSFLETMLQQAKNGQTLEAIADKWSLPLHVDDAAKALLTLLEAQISSAPTARLHHLANPGPPASWHSWAEYALSIAYPEPASRPQITPITLSSMMGFCAPRPIHTALDVSATEEILGYRLPSWQQAVERLVKSIEVS